MSLTTYREVCNELLNGLDELQDPRYPFPGYTTAAMDRARELLAQPAPATPARLRHCPTHGQQPPEAWGCPECVRELREELEALRAVIAADRARRAAPPPLLDLDALLSPSGPYETGPDAGNADGAQLVSDRRGNNPTWWAPVFGSNSLDDLLDRIRSRILPHLHPPVIGVDVHGPDGDWGNIADLCQAEGVELSAGARLLQRARAAWAWGQVKPPAEGAAWQAAAALRRLAAQNPMGVADPALIFAAELLQQQAGELATLRRQVVPVPVSERPWENEPRWLDPDGECWWCPPAGPAYWSMVNPAMVYGGWLLPAHAVPMPPEYRPHD